MTTLVSGNTASMMRSHPAFIDGLGKMYFVPATSAPKVEPWVPFIPDRTGAPEPLMSYVTLGGSWRIVILRETRTGPSSGACGS